MPETRSAAYAGSWYEQNGEVLSRQLGEWLQKADNPYTAPVRAIIAPHAGYRYSGRCAAYAYKHIDPSQIKRVFLLGPSHHYFTRKCCLSIASSYSSPLGDIPIDPQVYQELRQSGHFEEMSLKVDEAEHSLEMHLPYISKVMSGHDFTLVPIMVGALTPESEAFYGQVLTGYLNDPANLFVISSDFCHWGRRFNFTFHDKKCGPIYKSIEALDKLGLDIIEKQDTSGFTKYLRDYENTICGRHPIGVLLNVVQFNSGKFDVKFVQYEQSSQCQTANDSSVSYASGVFMLRG
ncbi:hypothetical protein CYMTET_9238 [Cymbomonas tetramitiformis]|uniref:Protein MEMO1 n=1 Tax=Cymbomonas tetramitiformis TaxID=36881 RepID=A0AAE0GRV9_9CHLO|nr:hypothetical protein CYMTET_9238 [Cymbomonas tetramitiformis]